MCAAPGCWWTALPTSIDKLARRVVAEVADRAPELTTGHSGPCCARCVWWPVPKTPRPVSDEAVEDRRVVVEANPSGAANLLLLDLSPDVAVAARERIDFLARRLPGDDRTMDQRRADIAVDLLCGHGKASGRGMVNITVDLRTLLGLVEHPGDLGGWGPVVADIARQVTDRQRDGRWQATVIDDDGDPLHGGGTAPPHRIPDPPSPGPAPHLRVPRMPPIRPLIRTRPHPTRYAEGGAHPRREPGSTVRIPPPGQRRRRLALPAPTPAATITGPAPTATPTSPAADRPDRSRFGSTRHRYPRRCARPPRPLRHPDRQPRQRQPTAHRHPRGRRCRVRRGHPAEAHPARSVGDHPAAVAILLRGQREPPPG